MTSPMKGIQSTNKRYISGLFLFHGMELKQIGIKVLFCISDGFDNGAAFTFYFEST